MMDNIYEVLIQLRY